MKSNVLLAVLGADYLDSCRQALQQLLEDVPGVKTAVVATTDGFEVASAGQDAQFAANRLAALASSLLALGQAALRELDMSGSGSVLIENGTGKILLIDVRRERCPVVLCVVAEAAAMTGKVLWSAKQCASRLGA
jgi:predicted regulator of Ras-like GTPase activity (Roadblock/LC7/MglB family)